MEGLEKKHTEKNVRECREMADIMHSGTVGLGCAVFKDSQVNACLCDGKKLSLAQLNRMEEAIDL